MKDLQSQTSGKLGGIARRYRPDSRFNVGLFGAVAALLREMVEFRSHILMLFSNEFKASYRGTALGVAWNLILPILPITVYVLLASLRVFPSFEGIPPAVYIGFNVTLWFLFTGFINRPIQVVQSRNNEIMKTAMPLSASIASSFARLCFDTLLRIAFVAALMAATATIPTVGAAALLPIVFAGSIFFLAVGLLLSILNVIYPDVDRVVTIILQYGIFLSGVIFPISSMGPLAVLETTNPFSVFIHAARDAVFFGTVSHPVAFAAWTAAGLVLLLVSARFFYLMEYRIRGLA